MLTGSQEKVPVPPGATLVGAALTLTVNGSCPISTPTVAVPLVVAPPVVSEATTVTVTVAPAATELNV